MSVFHLLSFAVEPGTGIYYPGINVIESIVEFFHLVGRQFYRPVKQGAVGFHLGNIIAAHNRLGHTGQAQHKGKGQSRRIQFKFLAQCNKFTQIGEAEFHPRV